MDRIIKNTLQIYSIFCIFLSLNIKFFCDDNTAMSMLIFGICLNIIGIFTNI